MHSVTTDMTKCIQHVTSRWHEVTSLTNFGWFCTNKNVLSFMQHTQWLWHKQSEYSLLHWIQTEPTPKAVVRVIKCFQLSQTAQFGPLYQLISQLRLHTKQDKSSQFPDGHRGLSGYMFMYFMMYSFIIFTTTSCPPKQIKSKVFKFNVTLDKMTRRGRAWNLWNTRNKLRKWDQPQLSPVWNIWNFLA